MNSEKGKNRWFKGTLYFLFGLLIILFSCTVIVAKSSRIQTFLTKKIISSVKENLGVDIEVKKVELELIKSVVLKDVLIKDHHQDTLAFISDLSIDINLFEFSELNISLDELDIEKSKFNLITYQGEEKSNLSVFLSKLKKDSTQNKSKTNLNLIVDDLSIDDLDVKIVNQNKSKKVAKVDYADLSFKNIDLDASDIFTDLKNHKLILDEASFLFSDVLQMNLSTSFSMTEELMSVEDLIISTDKSSITINDKLSFNKISNFKSFNDSINHELKLNVNSNVQDLAYFVPLKNTSNKDFSLSLDAKGSLNDLILNKLNVDLIEGSNINIQGEVKNVAKIKEAEFDIKTRDLNLAVKDYNWAMSMFKDNVVENKYLNKLKVINGELSINGEFEKGVLKLDVNTKYGGLKTETLYKNVSGHYELAGNLSSNTFLLGAFIANKDLGTIGLNYDYKLSGDSLNLNYRGEGGLSHVYFKNYRYNNVDLDVSGDKKALAYDVKLDDENGRVYAEGVVSFLEDSIKIQSQGRAKKVYPTRLGLMKRDSSLRVSAGFFTSFYLFDNNEEVEGVFRLDRFKFKETFYKYEMDGMSLEMSNQGETKKLEVVSDWIDATVKGEYEFKDLGKAFNNWVYEYLPGMKEKSKPVHAKLDLNCDVYDFYPIARIFALPFKCDEIQISGNWDNNYTLVNGLSIKLNGLVVQDQRWENLNLKASSNKESIELGFKVDTIRFGKKLYLANINVGSSVRDNEVKSRISWNNGDTLLSSGELKGNLRFSSYPKLKLDLNHSNFWLDSLHWKISTDSAIAFDSSKVVIPHFALVNNEQRLEVDGVFGETEEDKLLMSLDSFKIQTFEPLLNLIKLNIKGTANGEIEVLAAKSNPQTTGEITIPDFRINNLREQTFVLKSSYDHDLKKVSIDSYIKDRRTKSLHIHGDYYPMKKTNSLDMKVGFEKFNSKMISNYFESFTSSMRGLFYGEIDLVGTPSDFYLLGDVELKSLKMKIDYLGREFGGNGIVSFTEEGLQFNDFLLSDNNGSEGRINGKIKHRMFSNMSFDLNIGLEKFLCLETTKQDNELFYGKAVVTGDVFITGDQDFIILNIDAKTDSKIDEIYNERTKKIEKQIIETSLNIPLDSESDLSKAEFLTFVQNEDEKNKEVKKEADKFTGMEVNMDIDVNPEAEIKLIFDSKVGDEIRARGNSKLKMSVNSFGKFAMYGNYEIVEGDYLFTLKSVINKKFKLEKGSSVVWTGDPYNAHMNVIANYDVKTSAFDLLKYTVDQSAGDQASQQRYDEIKDRYGKNTLVQCEMTMIGSLLQPEITMDLKFPEMDEATKIEVANLINTEDEEMRQIFSLMLWGKFMAPSSVSTAGGSGYLNSGISTTTNELISNQLDLWLSQMSDYWDLGFNYENDNSGLGNSEVSVEVGKQVNERLNLSGNVGVASNEQSSGMIGEFEVDYRLSQNVNVKAYSENNNNDPSNVNGSTQGVSVQYQKEFDQVSELIDPIKELKLIWTRLENYFGNR